ncbi:MAG TPA: SseB family protein, partial [Candidatus Dormibacteraeota bacterium]|nr:SseB family protein [Candidatus Dormibacteraeota bacterium]
MLDKTAMRRADQGLERKLLKCSTFLSPVMAESRAAIAARFPENSVENAIQAAMARPDDAEALKAFYAELFDAEVVIPLDPKGPDTEVALPQGDAPIDFLSLSIDGVEHAVIFSSVSQLHLAFPSGCRFTKVKMSRLVPVWPDAPAVLNPEGFGRVLPAREIRGLPIGPIAA